MTNLGSLLFLKQFCIHYDFIKAFRMDTKQKNIATESCYGSIVIIKINNNINLSRFNVLRFTNWVLFFSLPI